MNSKPLLLALTLLAACAKAPDPSTPSAPAQEISASKPVAKDAMADLVAGNNAFALDLYTRLREQEGNLFFSPYSVSGALAMTYAGARGNTADEIKEVLHLPGGAVHDSFAEQIAGFNAPGKPYALSVANALWGQKGYGFLPEFVSLLEGSYGAGMNLVDFKGDRAGAVRSVNAWVSEKTNAKIKDILTPDAVDDYTRLVLTNAVYFKGDWERKFHEERTRKGVFFIAPEESAEVPMMTQKASFGYAEDENVQVLRLPYKGRELSMLAVLPKKRHGLDEVETALRPERLESWTASLQDQEVRVHFPKFKLETKFALSDTLQAMGMKDAFQEGGADFSGMDGTKELYISKVLHKAFVAVDEKGTEAAAATAVAISVTRAVIHETVFRADHPFLFLIRDERSGQILFLGRVYDPS